FIIAGTSLDEVDLEYYLSFRSRVTVREDRGPSILIEPSPDSVTRAYCERFGILLYHGTTEEFLDYLEAEVPDRPLPIGLVPKSIRDLFPTTFPERDVIAFSADFELVPDRVATKPSTSRFFYGHIPTWEDLAAERDVGRALTKSLIIDIDERLRSTSAAERFLILLDDVGSGKTTVLRRVAFSFSSRRIHVLICSALSRIEPEATARAIDAITGPLLVIVDNFADQASALMDVAARLHKGDVIFLGAERAYRQQYLYQTLSGLPYAETGKLRLTRLEAQQLVNRYVDNGLFGARQDFHNARFSNALVSDSIAIACCRILNDFHPLDRIIDSILKESTEIDRKRYIASAIAYFCYRGGVRYEVLLAVSGPDGWQKQIETPHPLPLAYLDRSDKSFIIPLNATVAGRVLERRIEGELLPLFIALANTIAPRVNRDAIKRRTPEARLAGRLFDYDQVVRGFLKELSATFYEETRASWRWNSRYWEQLALLYLERYIDAPASVDGRDALAQSVQHARHAVSIEHHPLPLTTLGKVLLAGISRGDDAVAATLYDEAFRHLTEAIDIERTRWSRISIQPCILLFRGTRDFMTVGGKLTRAQAETLRQVAREAAYRFAGDRELQSAINDIALIL
ncbi:MAG: hypothetical protein M3N13_05505, partial [Candidatus Eremiobacteraeota bacterium]|nr:hypothetical protein [Candidatus Eremiobacteraeota bacterium]